MARIPKVCVGCGGEGTVKEVLYGMPAHDYDRDKYILGGCSPENVVAECAECGWQIIGEEKTELFQGYGG